MGVQSRGILERLNNVRALWAERGALLSSWSSLLVLLYYPQEGYYKT
jgi:hypothetical protein